MMKSIQINEDLNLQDKDKNISDTYQNLAQVYLNAQQLKRAVQLLEKAVEVCVYLLTCKVWITLFLGTEVICFLLKLLIYYQHR